MDLAICATVQPTAAAASAAVRVLAGNSVMVSGWPAAKSAARTRATDPKISDIAYISPHGLAGAVYPLAVLSGQVPVLRLQLARARAHPAGALCRGAASRVGVGGGAARPPPAGLDLLWGRYAKLDGAGDGGGADRRRHGSVRCGAGGGNHVG